MAILIDPPAWHAHGRRWSHLVSDSDLEELHAFAQGLGIPRRGFEGDHYDLPEEYYDRALAAGAAPTDGRTLLKRLQASGLRLQKRRGDKGVAKLLDVPLPLGGLADIDLVASPNPMDERRVFAAMAFLRDAHGDFAVVHSVRRQQWGSPGGWREWGEPVSDNAIREIHEETGLVVEASALIPWGYERFRNLRDSPVFTDGRDVLQAYAVTISEVRPTLRAALPDTSDRRWVTPEEYAELCRDQFWWPLAERLLS